MPGGRYRAGARIRGHGAVMAQWKRGGGWAGGSFPSPTSTNSPPPDAWTEITQEFVVPLDVDTVVVSLYNGYESFI